ncbi:vascular endothelial zinc finger 1-like isoform X2 [Anguilla anguilla]|uniref:vascular endothelial zinc finger 1-like isoform X2 n=1 Tax=Anguilla anguilla TaxID=7936 RepID=UPI0015AE82E3|nr:vascular endothelial zinc finger 1-like isoform X2 [Anguilla anguilla]
MDAAWSNFLFQTPPTQNQAETALQSDLLPELTGSAENPPTEHIAPPPSTVDTAALNEEPVPVKPVSRPARAAHICPLCNKQFKNSYNLRRHQSVHTGIRMKDRAAREREEGVKEGRAERQTVPLSLLHLSVPPPLPPPQESVPHPPSLGGQESQSVAVSIATATVTMAIPPPLPTAVVVAGAMVQRPANLNPNPNPVRKNHACEACGKAFRDVYHLNRHRLSHSDEKPYSCPICQQRFKRKDRMSYHVRSHQGGVEKPYVCPHCAKGFSRPDHLNSHVRQVHSTERPFKCETLEPRADLRVGVRHTGSSARPHDPARGEGALPHLRQAAVRRLHHRSHEGSQPIAAPRLPPVQSHVSISVSLPVSAGFTTLTYLRVHAQKHHSQEWKDSGGQRGGFGGTGAGGVLLCQLCGVHCKTPTQLQGHMGTHTTPQSTPSPISSTTTATSASSASSVSLTNMVSSAVTLTNMASSAVSLTNMASSAVSLANMASSASVCGSPGEGLLVSDCSGIAPQSHS